MCRRITAGFGIFCLFWLTAQCGATQSPDWRYLRFEDLRGTQTAFYILVVAEYVQEDLAQEYTDSLSSGNEWWCITSILDYTSMLDNYVAGVDSFTAEVEKGAGHNNTALPPGERQKIDSTTMEQFGATVLFHSGKSWEFWRRVARLGRVVDNHGFRDSIDPEALRVLDEMRAAFKPLLPPQDPLSLGLGTNK